MTALANWQNNNSRYLADAIARVRITTRSGGSRMEHEPAL